MKILGKQNRILLYLLAFSILAHILFSGLIGRFGIYHFVAPVGYQQVVTVDLKQPVSKNITPQSLAADTKPSETDQKKNAIEPLENIASETVTKSVDEEAARLKALAEADKKIKPTPLTKATESRKAKRDKVDIPQFDPALRRTSEFLASQNEKLTYKISMLGISAGNAELQAEQREKGELKITLRVKSNAFAASLYPVDNAIEVKHINGNYIIARIIQNEGTFKGDTGFTIYLRDKKVTWIDLIAKGTLTDLVPTSDVLDTLSAFYYLRNRKLEVGKTELLHIYDNGKYSEVAVEILRREKLRLLNLHTVDTIVVKPMQETAGIFKRTGDITIWLTDDTNKTPVKIETSVLIGNVTAELVSSETTPLETEK